jgi:surfactin synthase thioesterase subunit
MMAKDPWFPFGTGPEAPIRLLTLPHAGAGASAFRAWGRGMAKEVAVCPVQPPGREGRYEEAPYTRVAPLARELAGRITTSVPLPYALLGHSTGALCAYEVVRELRRTGGPLPVHLFVGGQPAPQIPPDRRLDMAGLSVTELAAFLRKLGGTPEAILSDHGVLQWMQPILAADLAVNAHYAFQPEAPLSIPVTAFAGRADSVAAPELMEPWEAQTTAGFQLHLLDGGHFALFDHAASVHAAIADALAAYGELPSLGPLHRYPEALRPQVGPYLLDAGKALLAPLGRTDRRPAGGQILFTASRPDGVLLLLIDDDKVVSGIVVEHQGSFRSACRSMDSFGHMVIVSRTACNGAGKTPRMTL